MLNKKQSLSKLFLNTDFGKLQILNPILPKKASELTDLPYSILDDNSKAAVAFHNLRDPSLQFLIFNPSSRFGNALEITKSIRKRITENYFGGPKKIKNPFRNSKLSNEVFLLNRQIHTNMKYLSSRVGFIADRTGEVQITHKVKSNLIDNIVTQGIIKAEIDSQPAETGFVKPDYFISSDFYEGIVSYYGYNKNGIEVPSLFNRKIYPQYGVFLPTRKDYLELFNGYLKTKLGKEASKIENIADLGAGTGVLSFLMAQANLSRIFAIDNSEKALFTVKENAETLGYADRIKPLNIDLVASYSPTDPIKSELTVNSAKFDLIVCNPPWLNANYLPTQNAFENAVYDPKFRFLRSAFQFASQIITRNSPKHPK